MAYNSFAVFDANLDVNSLVQGPQVLAPYAYFGNQQRTELGAEDNFLKTTVWDDLQPSYLIYPFGNEGQPIRDPIPTVEFGQQTLKRFHLEVNQIKEGYYGDDPESRNSFIVDDEGYDGAVPGRASLGKEIMQFPENLCPQTNSTPRVLEESMWGLDAAQRVKSNFLLDLDTLDLYCGGKGTHRGAVPVGELGRYGNYEQYHDGPFPARGLPIKFQKVYFYGTRGQIGPIYGEGAEAEAEEKLDPFGDPQIESPFKGQRQSDGRGALFSTYILCANTAVNAINPTAGCEADGYDPTELSGYGLTGGSFRYLKENRAKEYDFFMSGKQEYNEGIDVEWNAEGYSTDAPLIIGDGALGFSERSLGKDIFGEVDIYQVTSAWKYYNVPITLCTGDNGSIEGTMLFRPDTFNAETKRLIENAKEGGYEDWAEKMVIHDMRNTFSCSGIMPTGDCLCIGCPSSEGDSINCGTECEYASLEHPGSPLPYQNEKVKIFDHTTVLMRTDPHALKLAANDENKCGCEDQEGEECEGEGAGYY